MKKEKFELTRNTSLPNLTNMAPLLQVNIKLIGMIDFHLFVLWVTC